MATVLSTLDYVIIAALLIASALIGVYFRFTGGKQKTILEYLLADKNMSILPVCFSVLATVTSAISVVGTPAEAYNYGMQMATQEITYSIAVCVVAYLMLPVYFERNINSVFEYIERRFGRMVKTAISVLYTLQMLLYVPVVIYAPSVALSTLTGLSVWTCVVSMASVCTFYSTLGGLKAILWTDVFQSCLMIFTILALIVKGSLDAGGFYEVLQKAKEGQRLEFLNTSTDLTVRYTLWSTMVSGFIYGLMLSGSSFHAMQRLISNGDFKKAKRSLLWSIPLVSGFQVAACILGTTMYAYYGKCDPVLNKEVESNDQIVPLFILDLFGEVPGLPGLCVAGIFSAALSTMSSVLNSMSFVTLEDYIKPFMKSPLKESTATFLVKVIVLFYGCFCLFLTFLIARVKGVLEIAMIVHGVVGAPLLGVVCLGMFTSTANEFGSATGLIAGFTLNAWASFGSLYKSSKYPSLPRSTAECEANNTQFYRMYPENSTVKMEIYNLTTPFSTDVNTEMYVFPLYKLSYLWFAAIGFLGTLITGYAASYLIGLWKPQKKTDPRYLSPVFREWLSISSVSGEGELEIDFKPTSMANESCSVKASNNAPGK